MATTVMDFLIEILRISPQTVSQYSNVTPIEQMFYLIFFPTLFILIFIYILTTRWMSEHAGFRILVAVAVYAFIIFQGYYDWFVMASKFWLFMLVILGAVWFVFRPKAPEGGGGAKGKALGGGIMDDLKRRFKGEITGEFKQREEMIMAMLKQIEDAMKKAGGNITDIDNVLGGGGGAMIMMARIYQMIWDLRRDEQIMGFAGPRVLKLIKRYNHVARALGAKTMPEK